LESAQATLAKADAAKPHPLVNRLNLA
jgi:hypothetical protein